MKKFLALLVCGLLWANPAFCDTTTPHYALTEPSINSISWGIAMNSNISTIDTNLWEASSGTVIGVNAPSASGSNIILTNPIDKIQDLAFTTTGLSVQLPAMNAVSSPVVGGSFSIKNVGTPTFGVLAADGSTVIVPTIMAGQQVSLTPLSDSTTNGTFSVAGPFISSVGTVFLGTSTTGASPAINGDNTTGFYTPSAGNIAATISGTEAFLIDSAGISVTGALAVTGTSAAATSITGVHSTTANALSLETTGVDRVIIGSDGGVLVGATTTGGDEGIGTLNASALYTNGVPVINSINIQAFNYTGSTQTYTPTPGMVFCIIEAVGGGGGAGGATAASGQSGAGSGGASGSYVKALGTAAQIGASQSVVIGAGGTAGASGAGGGGNGGYTSFGSYIEAAGGGAGGGSTATTSPIISQGGAYAGGSAVVTLTPISIFNGTAGSPSIILSGTQATNGAGGSSPFGNGGQFLVNANFAGESGGLGGGGSGAITQNGSTNYAGGAGGNGYVVITEYLQ